MTLPRIPSLQTIQDRLPLIFEGVDNETFCVRDSTAKTIAVMFYAGALDALTRWIRPSQVTDMTDAQLAKQTDAEREAWCAFMLSQAKKSRPADAWYATNSREQIRDENLRRGLIPNGAAFERPGLPTTTSLPKYGMFKDFADLFDETLTGAALSTAIEKWRKAHLTKSALSRVVLKKKGATAAAGTVPVTFPTGAVTVLAPGPSSVISKAVIEEFATKFLEDPAVLWLSESAVKVLDTALVTALGLTIDPAEALPDIILVDTAAPGGVLIVFVEVVNSDGPIDQQRREELERIAVKAGFDPDDIVYVTAFEDRASKGYRATVINLAWDSFVWFTTEPDCVVALRRGSAKKLTELR